eukprot:g3731.t1
MPKTYTSHGKTYYLDKTTTMSQTQLNDPLQHDTRSWGDIAMDEDEDEQTQNNTKQENNHPENDQDNTFETRMNSLSPLSERSVIIATMKRKREISLHTLYTKYVVIDHLKEEEKSNNTLENLNPTTSKGNSQKSAKLNPDRMKGKGTKPIQGKKIGETEWVDYTGCTEAARILNLSSSNINKVCKGKYNYTGEYVFRYSDDPDLEGEIWKENTRVGILVSNMGRVKTLTKNKGSLDQYYYCIRLKKTKYQVHRLVCQAFKWEEVQRKFAQQTKYTDIYSFWNKLQVDHIDGNKTNNHIDNLQPLTSEEHCKKTDHNQKKISKTQSKPILGKKDDGDWVPYSGVNQAARELKDISIKSIQNCYDTGKTIKGYQFKYAPDPDLPGEIWKDVPQEFFKHSVKGWRVSNKGRVHSKKGLKSYGNKHAEYKRFLNILVHRAVAAAFMQDQIMEVLRSQHVL